MTGALLLVGLLLGGGVVWWVLRKGKYVTPPKRVIRARHIHFGSLNIPKVSEFLPPWFLQATHGEIAIDFGVTTFESIPFPDESDTRPFSQIKIKYPHLVDADVVPIWYYEHKVILLEDLSRILRNLPSNHEVTIVTTDAQIEGLGEYLELGNAHVALVESIVIGGWAKGSPYAHLPIVNARLADVLTHEIGHALGMGHKCEDCQGPNMEKCCEKCPDRDNVMSYCRHRPDADTDPVNKFSKADVQQMLVFQR